MRVRWPRRWAEEDITVKRRGHTPEPIVRKLREVERLPGEGQTIAGAAKQVEISEQAYHRTRVTLPAAATVVALLATAAMLLAGCNRTDPEPAATTPTAQAPRSPQASDNDRAPASQGTAGPTPPATASAAPSPTAGREARSSASATEASTAPPESPRQEGSPTPTAAPAPPAPLPARDPDRGADAAGVNTRDPTPAGSGAASRGWPPAPTPQPGQVGAVAPSPTESGASARSTGGSVLHTWQDGEHTRRVYLQTNLVIQNTADNTAEDVVVRAGSRENIVQRDGAARRAGHAPGLPHRVRLHHDPPRRRTARPRRAVGPATDQHLLRHEQHRQGQHRGDGLRAQRVLHRHGSRPSPRSSSPMRWPPRTAWSSPAPTGGARSS